MKRFIPVKITDKKSATKLLNGDVFMRTLYEFGSWSMDKKRGDKKLDNDFRGDILEGASAVFTNINDCEFAKGLDPKFKETVGQVTYIDEDDSQYFKTFCLYCMEYNDASDFFFKPDPRLKDFGDTAVIIRDFDTFLRRLLQKLLDMYDKQFIFLMDRVCFFDSAETRQLNCMFEKHKKYAYQNELRILFGQLKKNVFARGTGAETAMSLVRNLDRFIPNIGDIRDIVIAMPIDDFLALKFPAEIKLRWPMSDDESKPFIFDNIVRYTQEQMQNYRSHMIRPIITIW